MSDNKYTAKEREFIRLHELQHTLAKLTREITQQVGERPNASCHICRVCKIWEAMDVLKDALLFQLPANKMNEAIDFVINKNLSGDADTDKAYANMTTQEIFQDLIAPTTEDNDDE